MSDSIDINYDNDFVQWVVLQYPQSNMYNAALESSHLFKFI